MRGLHLNQRAEFRQVFGTGAREFDERGAQPEFNNVTVTALASNCNHVAIHSTKGVGGLRCFHE